MRNLAFIVLLAALAGVVKAEDKPAAPAVPVVLDVTLKGGLTEEPSPIGIDGAPIKDNIKGVVDRIARAKNDQAVKGLVLRVHGLSLGMAKGFELTQAIRKFRESGKKAYAFMESAENADYLVAAAADEIVMPESGWLMLKGLAAEVTFYKGLFDKLGVKADWMQVGEFKSFGEPYTRTSMSPAFREEITSLLNDRYAMMAETIARRQGISVADAKALIDGGPYSPAKAKALGLISRIGYADQIEADVARSIGVTSIKLDSKYGKKTETVDLSGIAGLMKMMQMLSGDGPKKAESKADKIALIYCSGAIETGKSSSSLMGESTMGSETVVANLRAAERDKTVKAIVLRVDSPGGSALASDLIWREVTRIEKPIIASMSDVAASGGYYISMGADRIYAEPGTLTGSIGVTGGKFVVSGLMDKLGVTTDTITIGKNGTINSINQPFSETERSAMKKLMDDTYHQFVSKAAAGRKMSYDQLNKLAGGRVYTGRQAKELGLVDELGSLDDAIALAKQMGGIADSATPELLILPKSQGLLESLISPLEDRDVLTPAIQLAGGLLPDASKAVLARMKSFTRILTREPVAVMLPYHLQIR